MYVLNSRPAAAAAAAAATGFIVSKAGLGVTHRIRVGRGQAIFAVPTNSQVLMRTALLISGSNVPVPRGQQGK